ncbi:MAG: competence/damage-inducible protein A [Methermicoccaceae archaeon]
MKAHIISIGDELLCGDTVNTNAAWLAQQLSEKGVEVRRMTVIPDDIDEIERTVAGADADIVVITGGLGPTHDDITRFGIARAVGDELVKNKEALEFMQRTYDVSEELESMAYLPSSCVPLLNPVGSAPGCLIERDDRKLFVLPGVPAEMKAMFDCLLLHLHGSPPHIGWVVSTKPETSIAHVLKQALERFPTLKIGSYPREGKVRIKLTSPDSDVLDKAISWLESRV